MPPAWLCIHTTGGNIFMRGRQRCRSNGQHRTGDQPDDTFGHTSHNEMTEAAATMGRHDDQIHVLSLRHRDNGARGTADNHPTDDFDPCILALHQHLCEVDPSLALPFSQEHSRHRRRHEASTRISGHLNQMEQNQCRLDALGQLERISDGLFGRL